MFSSLTLHAFLNDVTAQIYLFYDRRIIRPNVHLFSSDNNSNLMRK